MRPIKFENQTDVLGQEQPEYQSLPVYIDRESDAREVISCWSLSWRERLTVLFTGKVWNWQKTFGRGFAPTVCTSENPWTKTSNKQLNKTSK